MIEEVGKKKADDEKFTDSDYDQIEHAESKKGLERGWRRIGTFAAC